MLITRKETPKIFLKQQMSAPKPIIYPLPEEYLFFFRFFAIHPDPVLHRPALQTASFRHGSDSGGGGGELTCGGRGALGNLVAGRLLPEDGLGSVLLLGLRGLGEFGSGQALLLQDLLLLPPEVLLLNDLPSRFLLLLPPLVFVRLPPWETLWYH